MARLPACTISFNYKRMITMITYDNYNKGTKPPASSSPQKQMSKSFPTGVFSEALSIVGA